MDFVFVDRESAYPNRYLMIPENGENTYVLLERADEVVTPGTPLNAETFNAMVAEINAKAPNVAYKFSSAFAATNPAPTDLLDIDIKDANLDGSSNMWDSYVVANNAATLTNCPVKSGAFHAFRTVETNPAGDFLVTLREVYPTLGRVWTAKYSSGSWEGWIANNPGDMAPANHKHSYNDLTDKPDIPSEYSHPSTHPASMITGLADVATSGNYSDLNGTPDSLPADGGDADSVGGYYPSDFAKSDHKHTAADLKTMLAAGNTVLSSYQYGTSLPSAGTAGRLFFKVVE